MRGIEAPPRRNGELVFAAPWEGRVFAMAIALQQRLAFPWNDFRHRLIAEIQRDPPAPVLRELARRARSAHGGPARRSILVEDEIPPALATDRAHPQTAVGRRGALVLLTWRAFSRSTVAAPQLCGTPDFV